MTIAIYCRTASNSQDSAASIKRQEEVCRAWLQDNKDPHSERAVAFKDAGISGVQVCNGEAFNELLERCQHREFSLVVCYSMDRLGRHASTLAGVIGNLGAYGVRVRSVTEPNGGTAHA